MTSFMQDNVGWLGERLKESAGRTVVYRRGQGTVTLIGTNIGHGELETDNVSKNGLVKTSAITDDWQFPVADLIIRGEEIEPRQTDVIVETLNGVEFHYEVLPSKDKRCFEVDVSGVLMTVHTKRVKAIA